ncbi:MAG: hypothetical protein HZB38_10370 [Planctomycetes bacterium]|nr:hypothetical protein [Planctomycetota bacterium]
MSDVSAIASFSAAQAAIGVSAAVGIKVLKLINQQQVSVAELIDGAVAAAEQISQGQISADGHIDVRA